MAIDCFPLKRMVLNRMNKTIVQFCKIENLFVIRKLKHINQLKNKLRLAYLMWGYRLLKESFVIITIAGPTVATKKERNNNDWETKAGNMLVGNIIPTSKLCEKSGVGNNRNPLNNPKIIEKYAVFSFNFLL